MIELVELVYLWIDGTMSLNIYHLCSRIASAGTLRIERCVPRSSLIPSFVWVPSPFDGPQILCGGFHSHGGTPIAGWLLEKIPNSNGWLGVHDSANLHVCFLIPSTVMTPKIWWMWYIFKGDFLIPPWIDGDPLLVVIFLTFPPDPGAYLLDEEVISSLSLHVDGSFFEWWEFQRKVPIQCHISHHGTLSTWKNSVWNS